MIAIENLEGVVTAVHWSDSRSDFVFVCLLWSFNML